MLPSDTEEYARLNIQNDLLEVLIGDLYWTQPRPNLIPEVLNRRYSEGGPTPAILDVGCGGGLWICEMARRFPHARCTGIDLLPILSL